MENIIEIIETLDYKASEKQQNQSGKTDFKKIAGVGIVIFALYMIISRFGGLNIFNGVPSRRRRNGYGMLFVIGLLTSLTASPCAAALTYRSAYASG